MVIVLEQPTTKTQANAVAIDITDEFDLLHAYQQTSSSAQRKAEIYQLYGLLNQLMLDLALGLYQPGRYRCFAVKEPKIREIFAPSFRDRLVHHLLVDRLMPLIDRRLIFDSFANRPTKGAHHAVRRLQKFMRQLPPTAYYMQCDIESYFTSINRTRLREVVYWHIEQLPEIGLDERHFMFEIIAKVLGQNPAHKPIYTGNRHLLRQIPRHKSLFHTQPDVGMPIGSLTSQFFSNVYLNELDRFVKHHLKAKHYLRYVDDFVLLHECPEQLNRWKAEISTFLGQDLALKLHPKKTLIQPTHRGCDYLGYIVRPHSIQVRRRAVKALRRRLYFFNHLLDPVAFPHFNPPPNNRYGRDIRAGMIKLPLLPTVGLLQNMMQVINSYYGTMGHANSYHLRRSIYLNQFHRLQKYFVPGASFTKMILRPVALLKREGIIAI
ncbi:MAG: RNA-directed DNA polymerase [Proteobacteria bacterium]|nr:RNA-directed DNA polymerase [Pseudomonadota bacterium]